MLVAAIAVAIRESPNRSWSQDVRYEGVSHRYAAAILAVR